MVTFYWITALVVGLGLFSWMRVCRSKPALHYFALKDESYNETDAQVGWVDGVGMGGVTSGRGGEGVGG